MSLTRKTLSLLLGAMGNRKAVADLVAVNDNSELLKPVSSYKAGEMLGDAEYVLKMLSTTANILASKIEAMQDIQALAAAVNQLSKRVDALGSSSDLKTSVNLLAAKINSIDTEPVKAAVNLLADKASKQATAIRDLASKLDAEDVTNLDTDYESVVNPNL